jgi:protein-S-isoprenylcysteine O-methyltransferase Ste14
VLHRLSVAAFALMVLGLMLLYYWRALFASHPAVIAVQVAAFLLMVSARIAFGRRSFHAAAEPTAGGLVTSGPYAYVRHPIYAAILYFTWAGALSHFSWRTLGAVSLITAGAIVRMLSEERLLTASYPAYRDYMARVKRVVPFVA